MFVLSPTRPRVRTGVVALCLTVATWAAPAAHAASHVEESTESARAKLSRDVLDILDNGGAAKADEPVRIIVQGTGRSVLRSLTSEARRSAKALDLIDGVSATVSRDELMSIAKRHGVRRISVDREVASSAYDYNHLRVTTGASQVIGSAGVTPLTGQFGGYLAALPADGPSGAGVGIAIVDSGIYDPPGASTVHRDLKNLNSPGVSRVVVHQDFCSLDPAPAGPGGYDPYGHGTHVAAAAAGNGYESLANQNVGNEYSGLAYGANLIDCRVLSGTGSGLSSDCVRALDWIVAHKATYNIRVVNMSLGAAVVESFTTDPVCQAVQRAIDSGITVVVAAGNAGKDSAGNVVYGSILSPANLPDAITVGAAKTNGTNVRSDDTVASFSSRGPSLVDGVVKPDLVAPGDHIIASASNNNYLEANYPSLILYRETTASGANDDVYMQMSGTSVASPVVAGAAALLIAKNPNLSPKLVKAILRLTAQPLNFASDPWIDYLSEGAGLLNVEGAMRVTGSLVANPSSASNGDNVVGDASSLTATVQPDFSYASTIAGQTFTWGNALSYEDGYAFGRTETGALQILKVEGIQTPDGWILGGTGWIMGGTGFVVNGSGWIMGGTGWIMGGTGWIMGGTGWIMGGTGWILGGTGWIMGGTGWILGGTSVLTDATSAETTWSSCVLDPTSLPTTSASHIALDALGDSAPGNAVRTIPTTSPYYPQHHQQ